MSLFTDRDCPDCQRKETEIGKVREENDTLRMIAAKVMPCHYCGAEEISKCPHGFPGCGLADDVLCGEEPLSRALQEARVEIERLRVEKAEYRGKAAAMMLQRDEAQALLWEALSTLRTAHADVVGSFERAECASMILRVETYLERFTDQPKP